jgi:hypothetical protein
MIDGVKLRNTMPDRFTGGGRPMLPAVGPPPFILVRLEDA